MPLKLVDFLCELMYFYWKLSIYRPRPTGGGGRGAAPRLHAGYGPVCYISEIFEIVKIILVTLIRAAKKVRSAEPKTDGSTTQLCADGVARAVPAFNGVIICDGWHGSTWWWPSSRWSIRSGPHRAGTSRRAQWRWSDADGHRRDAPGHRPAHLFGPEHAPNAERHPTNAPEHGRHTEPAVHGSHAHRPPHPSGRLSEYAMVFGLFMCTPLTSRLVVFTSGYVSSTWLYSLALPNTALPPPGIGGPQMGSSSAAQTAAAMLGLQRCVNKFLNSTVHTVLTYVRLYCMHTVQVCMIYIQLVCTS